MAAQSPRPSVQPSVYPGMTPRHLHIVALTVGSLGPSALFTLRELASSGHRLTVIRSAVHGKVPATKKLKRLVRTFGLPHTASRLAGKLLFVNRDDQATASNLEAMFAFAELRRWWAEAELSTVDVPTLNGRRIRAELKELSPDLLVRVSGGILKPKTFASARLGALNIHHGMAPAIRGMWSIPWGLLENRPDWVGATVHQIDAGIDTGKVYWRGGAQIAPGDTADGIFFRSHLLAVEGLLATIDSFARGQEPPPVEFDGDSTYRTAPGLPDWLRFYWYGRGRRAPATIAAGVK